MSQILPPATKWLRSIGQVLAIAFLLAACGGGGGGDSGSPADDPGPTPSVSVSPASADVDVGDDLVLEATVTGAGGGALAWEVEGVEGGDADVGWISAAGVYTPPEAVDAPRTFVVTVRLEDDPQVSADATVRAHPRFSDRTLRGSYVFLFTEALDSGEYARVGGVFEADGSGRLNGTVDIASTVGVAEGLPMEGTYAVNEDGEGVATIRVDGDIAYEVRVLARNRDQGAVEGATVGERISGRYVRRTEPDTVVGPGEGAFTFSYSGLELSGMRWTSSIGRIAISSSGQVLSGDQDLYTTDTADTGVQITGGNLDVSGADGRGTATVWNQYGPTRLRVYMVDDDSFHFLGVDGDELFSGIAYRLPSGEVSAMTLEGAYMMGLSSRTGIYLSRFTLDGGGNVLDARVDRHAGSFVEEDQPLAGTYTLNPNARGILSVDSVPLTRELVLRLVNPNFGWLGATAQEPADSGVIRHHLPDVAYADTLGSYEGPISVFSWDGAAPAPTNFSGMSRWEFSDSGNVELYLIGYEWQSDVNVPVDYFFTGTASIGEDGCAMLVIDGLGDRLRACFGSTDNGSTQGVDRALLLSLDDVRLVSGTLFRRY